MLIAWIKKNIVLIIALIAAAATSVIVRPDAEYLRYFDYRTLACLFSMLAVVCALKNIRFFQMLAENIIAIFGSLRSVIIALVCVTFIGSMFIANDMALITFLPLGLIVLKTTNNTKHTAFVFIMQDIAANLGGMLTPFGNPQNLYLYSYFNIPNSEFIRIMFLPFIISIVLIIALCYCAVKPERLKVKGRKHKVRKARTVIYLVLFALSIMMVFRTIPYYWGMAVIIIVLLVMDYKALLAVDYPLLFTFCAFFVFSGNMARIPQVSTFIDKIIAKNTLLFGTLCCQFISNVPSAILLSKFTDNYPQLLVAVNIGGVGTLIASLASLITFREYIKHEPDKTLNYLGKFSLYNFGMLIILLTVMSFVFR